MTPMLVCEACGMGHVERPAEGADYWNRQEGARELEEVHWEARRRLFEKALSRIEAGRKPGRVVDLGGGVGYFAEAALRRGWDAYSMDTSPLAQAAAAERIGADRSLSAQDLAGHKAACDLVTVWCVIAHVVDPQAILAEAVELLKPGGTLLVTTPNFLFQAPYARALSALKRPLDFVAHDHWLHFTPSALDRLLRRAGLQRWAYTYLGVTEDCVLERRLSAVLVPAKRIWNRVAVNSYRVGLPPLSAELQVLGVKPG